MSDETTQKVDEEPVATEPDDLEQARRVARLERIKALQKKPEKKRSKRAEKRAAKPKLPKIRTRDYGYSNARARGMRSRLLKPSFFEELIAAPDQTKMIQLLSDTEYGQDLDTKLIHGRTFAVVDEALKVNMLRTYRKLIAFSNDEIGLICSTLLARWDLFNLKTILRGKHMKLQAAEIEQSLMPVGGIPEVELSAIARLDSVRAIADTMVTWGIQFAQPLRDVVGEYVQSDDLSILELALDRYYTEWAAYRLKGKRANFQLARDIFGMQVDSTNLLTAFRLLKADTEGLDVERYFLEGGLHVDKEMYLKLTSLSDVDEVIDHLKGTPYSRNLEHVLLTYLEEGAIAVFERALENFVMNRALGAGSGDPLGAGIIISYIYAKQNEITNLRIIVKCKSVGMPPDRMRKELILV
jgi:V/A-type H+-transporting ATPase subunit C